MAPTSEERREVARRIRNNVNEQADWVIPWAVFNDAAHHGDRETMLRLADLIDPTCGEWRDDPHPVDPAGFIEDDSELWCEHCDIPLNPDYRYCPYCGARVVGRDAD